MANARTSSVLILDTTGQMDGSMRICGIKYIGATAGTATIKADTTSGTVVWEESGTANIYNHVDIRLKDGLYVTLAGTGTKVYVYLEK